jgi:hypothetical protein
MEELLGLLQFLLIVITLYTTQSYFRSRNKVWLYITIFYFLCFFISFTYSSWWPIVIALLAAVYYIVGWPIVIALLAAVYYIVGRKK